MVHDFVNYIQIDELQGITFRRFNHFGAATQQLLLCLCFCKFAVLSDCYTIRSIISFLCSVVSHLLCAADELRKWGQKWAHNIRLVYESTEQSQEMYHRVMTVQLSPSKSFVCLTVGVRQRGHGRCIFLHCECQQHPFLLWEIITLNQSCQHLQSCTPEFLLVHICLEI